MHWIALLPPEPDRPLWSWRALQFTPRVAQVEELLLLEVSVSQRLWRGPDRLLRLLLGKKTATPVPEHAQGATSLLAIALLRLRCHGQAVPARLPDGLPLSVLSAARTHLEKLERIGCRSWGDLRALPRGGVARRFGASLLDALDAAYGERPERYPWLLPPEIFDMKLELPAPASSAPELMWTAQRLLLLLQAWLRARQLGLLAFELEWTLDWRRLDGADLPAQGQLQIRTARPTRNMAHLRRLLAEHLAQAALAAPASQLRLRSLQTAPWAGASTTLLPEEQQQGESLQELVERLSARLGLDRVRVARAQADHRPERMQLWLPAQEALPRPAGAGMPGRVGQIFYPCWLLAQPLRLEVNNDVPHYGGPLRRLLRMYRMEAGWWEGQGPVLRDYFLARSEQAGLVWIYRERPPGGSQASGQARWFLQGLYA